MLVTFCYCSRRSKGWSYAYRYQELAGILRQVPGVKVQGVTGEAGKMPFLPSERRDVCVLHVFSEKSSEWDLLQEADCFICSFLFYVCYADSFEVLVGDQLIYSKLESGAFPDVELVGEALRHKAVLLMHFKGKAEIKRWYFLFSLLHFYGVPNPFIEVYFSISYRWNKK